MYATLSMSRRWRSARSPTILVVTGRPDTRRRSFSMSSTARSRRSSGMSRFSHARSRPLSTFCRVNNSCLSSLLTTTRGTSSMRS